MRVVSSPFRICERVNRIGALATVPRGSRPAPYITDAPDNCGPSNASTIRSLGQYGISVISGNAYRYASSIGRIPRSCSMTCPTSLSALNRRMASVSSGGGTARSTCILRNALSLTPLTSAILINSSSVKPSVTWPMRRNRVRRSHSSGRSSVCRQAPRPLLSRIG